MPPREGDVFEVVVSQAGIPLRWVGKWIAVENPCRLVDVGVETPFASWRHEHRFECKGEFSLITDEVHYELAKPWSKFPPARWMADLILRLMFLWRHYRSRRIFGTPDTIA
jgi:ligand-binding SRPBCC domain-containing protein